jgi:hypothetical protein
VLIWQAEERERKKKKTKARRQMHSRRAEERSSALQMFYKSPNLICESSALIS